MAGFLVLLQDDVHDETGLDVFSVLTAQDANSSLGDRATASVALPVEPHNFWQRWSWRLRQSGQGAPPDSER
jgi:hypothetical protein